MQKESRAVSLGDIEVVCRDIGGHGRPTGD